MSLESPLSNRCEDHQLPVFSVSVVYQNCRFLLEPIFFEHSVWCHGFPGETCRKVNADISVFSKLFYPYLCFFFFVLRSLSSFLFLCLKAVAIVMSLSSLKINRAVSTVYLEKEMMWMYLMLTMSHELHRLLLKTWQAAPLSWDIIWRVHTTARIQMQSEKRIQGGRINNY